MDTVRLGGLLLTLAFGTPLLFAGSSAFAFAPSEAPLPVQARVEMQEFSTPSPGVVLEPLDPSQGPSHGVSVQSVVYKETFESIWNGWTVAGVGWTQAGYRRTGGSYSAYCAGSLVAPPGPYPNNVDTWMLSPRIDLSGASNTALIFDLWLDAQPGSDYLFAGASHDGTYFEGVAWEGNSSGWVRVTVDLSAYSGDSSVWVAFHFASDGSGNAEGAYVDNVTVATPGNTTPLANTHWLKAQVDVTKNLAAPGVLAGSYDADDDPLVAELVSGPIHGSLVLNVDGSFTYAPAAGYVGPDLFRYRVFDGLAYSDVHDVHLAVNPPSPPYAASLGRWLHKGEQYVLPATEILRGCQDDNDDPMTPELASPPTYGQVTVQEDGSFVYTPPPWFVGTDVFTFHVRANGDLSNEATVWMMVEEGSDIISIYRFYNARLGTHFYTSDPVERDNVIRTLGGTYAFEGVAYSTSVTNNGGWLYRFYKPSTGTHFYTANEAERDYVKANLASIYTYEGEAYRVSTDNAFGTKRAVYRFYNVRNGTHFYTVNESEKWTVQQNLSNIYTFEGIAFYLGQ